MPDVLTLPEHFKNSGYETVSVGKIYHHPKDDLQGWSKEPFQSKGDWKGRGYLTDEALEAMAICDEEEKKNGGGRTGLGPAFECADVADDDYHDGKDALAAIAELDRLKSLDKPFFLGLGFHKPHLPFSAPKKYWDMYTPEELPFAENRFEPDGVTEFSLTNFGELRGYFGIPDDGDVPDDLAKNLIHGYCACVSYMDAQLGKVIEKLKSLGLWDNTAIVLWGDHGWKLGEHNSWSKHTNFEIDTRAPLIIRDPDSDSFGATTALAEFVDMYPTLCDLCDISIPEHCEGVSLKPILNNKDETVKDVAFSQYPRDNEVMGYAMRTDQYRYMEWTQAETRKVFAKELYDHYNDSQENKNIASTASAELLDKLSKQLNNGWQAVHKSNKKW